MFYTSHCTYCIAPYDPSCKPNSNLTSAIYVSHVFLITCEFIQLSFLFQTKSLFLFNTNTAQRNKPSDIEGQVIYLSL